MSSKKRRRAQAARATPPARPRGQWMLWTAIAAVIVALLVVALRPRSPGGETIVASAASQPAAEAPPFRVTTLDGRELSDDQLRGKVVLVNFWATWCPPCRAEMPGFEEVYARHADSDFVVLGVAMDVGSSVPVARFLSEHHITYPVAMAEGSIARNFGGANFLPNSFLIDRRGRIRNEVRGVYDAALLERHVQELLAERDVASGDGAGAR